MGDDVAISCRLVMHLFASPPAHWLAMTVGIGVLLKNISIHRIVPFGTTNGRPYDVECIGRKCGPFTLHRGIRICYNSVSKT